MQANVPLMGAITFIVVWFIIGLVVGLKEYSSLPDTIPIHFGIDGKPDAYGSKQYFFSLMYGIVFGISLSLMLVSLLIPKIPQQYINVPNKTYWISHPEEFSEALKKLQVWNLWLAGIIAQLLVSVFISSIYMIKKGDYTGFPAGIIPVFIFLIELVGLLIAIYKIFAAKYENVSE
jgi:uncharacterized membrane protein